jgi:integrase
MPRPHVGSVFKKRPDAAKWSGAYTDPMDRRRVVVTLYTDRRASEKRLQELITEAERRAAGITDRFAEHRQRPIREHIAEYLERCRHVQESEVHVGNKRTQLERLVASIGAHRLTDLEPIRVEQHLQALAKGGRTARKQTTPDPGLSARSVNQHRATAVAFAEWCVETGRLPTNPLKIVPKMDERKDRRRVRRACTSEELSRLLDHCGPRRSVYLIAVLTGLRRNELRGIEWRDVDLEAGRLVVRVGVGKAAREDTIPLHPQAVEEFRRIRPPMATARVRVFATIPRDKTVRADLRRAGVAIADDAGRVVDFHALRTTFATMLALRGASPQEAMRLMRHSDMRTTMKHYTVLRLKDQAAAVERLDWVGDPAGDGREAQRATGTDGRGNPGRKPGAGALASVVAPVVAQRALGGALGFVGVQEATGRQGPMPAAGGTGQTAQPGYTSGLGIVLRDGARVVTADDEKSKNHREIRAIGAVG